MKILWILQGRESILQLRVQVPANSGGWAQGEVHRRGLTAGGGGGLAVL